MLRILIGTIEAKWLIVEIDDEINSLYIYISVGFLGKLQDFYKYMKRLCCNYETLSIDYIIQTHLPDCFRNPT